MGFGDGWNRGGMSTWELRESARRSIESYIMQQMGLGVRLRRLQASETSDRRLDGSVTVTGTQLDALAAALTTTCNGGTISSCTTSSDGLGTSIDCQASIDAGRTAEDTFTQQKVNSAAFSIFNTGVINVALSEDGASKRRLWGQWVNNGVCGYLDVGAALLGNTDFDGIGDLTKTGEGNPC